MKKIIKHIESKIDFSNQSWKPFWIGFIYIFLAVIIHQLIGAKIPKVINIQTAETGIYRQIDALDKAIPMLQEKVNTFKLKRPISFISSAFAAQNYDNATSYIAVNYNTGDVLLEKNSSRQVPIASLTKLMTAVVSLDLAKPNDIFTVSNTSAKEPPTKIGVIPGQKMSLEELLNASLLTSANDSAEVIKEGINAKYGSDIFTRAMNKKAEFLGLKNTRFDNPQGFDSKDNYSSAEDLAVLSAYALKNYPLISEIVQKDYRFLPADNNHKQFDLYNWNGLLDVYPGVKGVKIGNTDAAGYTTIVVAERDNQKILVVLLGADSVLDRDMWTSGLLDDSFQKLGSAPASITEQQLIGKYSTWKYWN